MPRAPRPATVCPTMSTRLRFTGPTPRAFVFAAVLLPACSSDSASDKAGNGNAGINAEAGPSGGASNADASNPDAPLFVDNCPDRGLQPGECDGQGDGQAACCNANDKCLVAAQANGMSAVSIATTPCEIGCAATPATCLDCINGNLQTNENAQLGAACGECHAQVISCSAQACLSECLANSLTLECRECVRLNCVQNPGGFNDCTGLLSNGT